MPPITMTETKIGHNVTITMTRRVRRDPISGVVVINPVTGRPYRDYGFYANVQVFDQLGRLVRDYTTDDLAARLTAGQRTAAKNLIDAGVALILADLSISDDPD